MTGEGNTMNLTPGDFVQLKIERHDVWHEVKMVFDDAVIIYTDNSSTGTSYELKHLLRCSHAQHDPWQAQEVRIVHTAKGTYGRTKRSNARSLKEPLPDIFRR